MIDRTINNPPCPICFGPDIHPIFSKAEMPLYNLQRFRSRTDAQNAKMAAVDFRFCSGCGFAFNTKFDPEAMSYAVDYESSRSQSSIFMEFLRSVVKEVAGHFALMPGDLVIEIGCSNGDFLIELANRVSIKAFGFDPSISQNKSHTKDDSSGVTLLPMYYIPEQIESSAPRLLILRHVLEHQSAPEAFLKTVLMGVESIYIEVPAWEWIVSNDQFYAFSYEHCSYFSQFSIDVLMSRLGFSAVEMHYGFNGEYLQYFGKRKTLLPVSKESNKQGVQTKLEELRELESRTLQFTSKIKTILAKVRTVLLDRASGTAVLWGAGGKGITMLNVTDVDFQRLPFVVDINPNKDGIFVPRMAQEVILPQRLESLKPEVVFYMNPLYLDEIQSTLKSMGLNPKLVPI